MNMSKLAPAVGGLLAIMGAALAPQTSHAQSADKIVYPYISAQAGMVRAEFDDGFIGVASEKGFNISANAGVDFFLLPDIGLSLGLDVGYSYADEMEFTGPGSDSIDASVTTLGGTFAIAPFPTRNVRLIAGVGLGFWDVGGGLGEGTGEDLYYNFGMDTVVAPGLRLFAKYNLQEIDTGARFNLDIDGINFGLKYYY